MARAQNGHQAAGLWLWILCGLIHSPETMRAHWGVSNERTLVLRCKISCVRLNLNQIWLKLNLESKGWTTVASTCRLSQGLRFVFTWLGQGLKIRRYTETKIATWKCVVGRLVAFLGWPRWLVSVSVNVLEKTTSVAKESRREERWLWEALEGGV